MPKGRGGILLIAFLILLILVVVWLLRREGGLGGLGARPGQIPIELTRIIPSSWNLLEQQIQPCSFDDDPDNEWLVLYRYDRTSVPNVATGGGPQQYQGIGGVVYDAQVNRAPQELRNVSPYRPALLVPYKLLPDYYTGKGQGYLGETDVKFYKYAPGQEDATLCKAEEFYFLGYSDSRLPTRLSIFRWKEPTVGYQGVHFVGNAHVDVANTINVTQPITQVTTYNRLANHRSLLCEVRQFNREGALSDLRFSEKPGQFTIDFCYGTPEDPAYPEAALIAFLRGASPLTAGSPTGASFLTRNAEVDPRLRQALDREKALRILSVANQGTIAPIPGAGTQCSPAAVVTPVPTPTDDRADNWWCAAEEAYVEAEIVLGSDVHRAVARLISIANEQVTTDVHWRVANLSLQ